MKAKHPIAIKKKIIQKNKVIYKMKWDNGSTTYENMKELDKEKLEIVEAFEIEQHETYSCEVKKIVQFHGEIDYEVQAQFNSDGQVRWIPFTELKRKYPVALLEFLMQRIRWS